MVELAIFVNMYYSRPMRLAKSNMEKLNFCQFSNVICDGSELWVYMVKMGKSGDEHKAAHRRINTHSMLL